MPNDDFSAAVEHLNAGAEIPVVKSALIERMWEALSRVPPEQKGHVSVGLGAFVGIDLGAMQNPEQTVAILARYALLDGLVERGVLDEYMKDESQRRKVFAAVASFPCNKDDMVEATLHKMLRESSAEDVQKAHAEFRAAGYDPEHPKVVEKLEQWIHDYC